METITYAGQVFTCPFSNLVPPLSPDQRAGLAADILRNGVQVPVVVSDTWQVLDGHDRLAIAAQHKLPGVKFIEKDGLSEAEKVRLAVALNVHRRHMDPAARRRLIVRFLTADPGRSNRDIAADADVSHNTVKSVRERLEATGQIDQLATTTGRDGKKRPAKPARPKPAPISRTLTAGAGGPRWSSPKTVAGDVDNLARRVKSAGNLPKSQRSPAVLVQLADALQRQAVELRHIADTIQQPAGEDQP